MSRSHATRKRNTGHSNVPGWVWLFTGTVLGAFVMFLLYLRDVPSQPSTVFSGDEPSASDATDDEEQTGEIPKPRFVFYELLKESEVIVEPPAEDDESVLQPPPANTEYILQAGSFRNPQDADRLRAELLLLNLDAQVAKTQIGEQTWHRVMVGPFQTRAMAAKARGTLASMDVDSIMRERQPSDAN